MVEMTKENWDAMNAEITSNSESLWNKELTDAEDGIKLSTLFDILDKYIKKPTTK